MINYKDLMVGDWVYLSEKSKYPMRVESVGVDYCYLNFDENEGDPFDGIDKDMMPIEANRELLLKNGFETSGYPNEEGYAVYEKETEDYYISIFKSKNKWFCEINGNELGNEGNFYFTYLHELQNGIRLITKGNLEIWL